LSHSPPEQWQQVIQGSDELNEGGFKAIPAPSPKNGPQKGPGESPRKSPMPRGDTVIRIEKSHHVGSERSLMKQRTGEHSGVEMTTPYTPATDEEGATEPEDDAMEDDDDDRETSYIDSLEGMSSENDEDYDVRRDHIDLPEHLLPPPKPIIRGSFVQGGRNSIGGEMKPEAAAAAADKNTAANRIKTFFGGGSEPTTPKSTQPRLANRTSSGAAAEKRRSNRRSGGGLSPQVAEAIISPMEERGLARRKSLTEQRRKSMEQVLKVGELAPTAAAAADAEVSRMATHSYAVNGNASAGRQSVDTRGSVFSTMFNSLAVPSANPGDNPISTIHESAGDGAEGELEGEEANLTNGQGRARGASSALPPRISESPPSLVISVPSSPTATKSNPPAQSNPASMSLSAASSGAAVRQPTSNHDFLSSSPRLTQQQASVDASVASNPQFWTELQAMLTQTMQPLQQQYSSLVAAHGALQEKHAATEQLIRTLAEKLKEARAQNQRGSGDPTSRLTNPRVLIHTRPESGSASLDEEKGSRRASLTVSDGLHQPRRKSLRTLGINEDGEDVDAPSLRFAPVGLNKAAAPAKK
jgi:hypothetical protein